MATVQLCFLCVSLIFFNSFFDTNAEENITEIENDIYGASDEEVGAIIQGLPDKEYGDLLKLLADMDKEKDLIPHLYKKQLTDLLNDDEKKKVLEDIPNDALAKVDPRDKKDIPPSDVPSIVTKLPFPLQSKIYNDLPRDKQIAFSRTIPNAAVGKAVKSFGKDLLDKYIEVLPQSVIDVLKKKKATAACPCP
ncbi:hypothetical protein JTE90_022699 [Oedothorax gibbosus]|uniref:Uncharacterized protein n=1 Tax=Oedothorax gibbosus TaxID=931172 RepID=A0AAV6UN23_9ARAC|nr:hypothetical protein JTE90_022699 [Oedothorax gibbosus]